MFKEYGELSTKLYEHTKPIGHSIDGDIEYYEQKLTDRQGPILEAGVGTGRMLIPFLKKGIAIDGVDLSFDMLDQCKKNMQTHQVDTNLYQQDLMQLSLPQTYDTIIMPTGSFCLLPKDQIELLLQNLYHSLKKGGQFIFDISLPTDFKANETEINSYALTKNSGILFTSISEDINWIEQHVSYIHKYELLDQGAIQQTEISHFTLFWYGLNELKMLLENAGFNSVDDEIDYGKAKNGSIVTFIAEKA
ncbi:class I SAM-dependent DNA methyltransferase [Gracilibacillus phocaeensis]|uniref:class I SAM-dependent DNA methyltransferase n=1 Tax=Gracilibacillus phocaeensis TaxID=2042304 RepID=UPI00103197DD|nr:class I SAM-dependent methyltransferase [Gracilibacillus phocaeensis]